MLTSLRLTNYRGFSQFEIERLGRINLLVGKNNVGKTTLLEAAEIVASGATPSSLLRSIGRRGESTSQLLDSPTKELEIHHLFNGHTIQEGDHLELIGELGNFGPASGLTAEIVVSTDEQGYFDLSNLDTEDIWLEPNHDPFALRLTNVNTGNMVEWPLTRRNTLPLATYQRHAADEAKSVPVINVPTEGLTTRRLGSLWSELVLTSEEDRIIQALNLIEEGIERITYISSGRINSSGSFLAKIRNLDERIPFGSMGDGIKRLLALSIAVTRCAGGLLLVDEVDTGLHYSALPDMWHLLGETARRLNVQVIATTHSGDCVRALSYLHQESPHLMNDILIHRIERGQNYSTTYDGEDLEIAAKHHMELR